MLVALGITAYRGIPRQEDPYFPIPIYQIIVVYPGAEPQDIERLVVKPIEDRLSELDDIKKIESHSNDGVAVIQPEFYSRSTPRRSTTRWCARSTRCGRRSRSELTKVEIRKSNPGSSISCSSRWFRRTRPIASSKTTRATERHAQNAQRRAHRGDVGLSRA
jgi:multidrug efflux pump subunit AcrB